MQWNKRTVVDQNVQYPYRYQIKDSVSGATVGIYEIKPVESAGDISGTQINAEYLQPIEDFILYISERLTALQLEISVADENAKNEIERIDEVLPTLAPIKNAVFENPRANTVAVSANSDALCTTAAVKQYFDELKAQYEA